MKDSIDYINMTKDEMIEFLTNVVEDSCKEQNKITDEYNKRFNP